MQWIAIGFGAALGACLRAWLGRFNIHFGNVTGFGWLPHWFPLGTLFANVLGGLLIGMAIVVFNHWADSIHPHIKMMLITGFLGGLTTFSTFNAEVFGLLNDGKMIFGLTLAGTHFVLTLLATAIGFYFMKAVL
ncbi:MAG: chromosome condensation protein CrcB [Gammaproteobacteria bacterium]|nr:MAG: chromosome condensation protein CrcB [Gammaproteobacteria bacterium]